MNEWDITICSNDIEKSANELDTDNKNTKNKLEEYKTLQRKETAPDYTLN